ncbi:MAG: U32 family peptidase [Bacteroidales bacterium]|nr:U32 family peptidase [Bacteroidales bacterium]
MATKIELLAPAKDLECGIAAINHGADAVYVGAPQFSARVAAGNSLDDIEKLCRHAHLYHAHVYVALTTLLTGSELETARKLIYQLYEAGADALIIQDTGILQLDLPPIAVHASTQTDNRSVEKVKFWENIGLQRVILARELSLQQIRGIRSQTSIELETFVHGALCVSYSGQCYMSQSCVGRSANRGNCAQFCRLPYTLTDADGKVIRENSHLLSLKDMNRSDSLLALMEAGITSLKIEGRLKGMDYVKNITAFYRQKLDAIFAQNDCFIPASDGNVSTTFTPNPHKTFNRGNTEYFLHHRENVMVTPDTPKSIGEPAGQVTAISGKNIRLRTPLVLHNGDGLGFVDDTNELRGFRINRVEGQTLTTLEPVDGLKVGMPVFRNYDIEFDKLLQSDSARRTLAVDMTVEDADNGISLTVSDEGGTKCRLEFSVKKELSLKGEAANQQLKQNLSKLGGTMFRARSVEVRTRQPYFFPASVVNEWRRTAVNTLMQKRISSHVRPVGRGSGCGANSEYPLPIAKKADYRANVMNGAAADFYRQHGALAVAPAFEKQTVPSAVLMTCKHCIRFTLGFCSKSKREMPFREPLYLQTESYRFRLEFDCQKCEMNVLSIEN